MAAQVELPRVQRLRQAVRGRLAPWPRRRSRSSWRAPANVALAQLRLLTSSRPGQTGRSCGRSPAAAPRWHHRVAGLHWLRSLLRFAAVEIGLHPPLRRQAAGSRPLRRSKTKRGSRTASRPKRVGGDAAAPQIALDASQQVHRSASFESAMFLICSRSRAISYLSRKIPMLWCDMAEDARAALERLIRERGRGLCRLSRLIGRNAGLCAAIYQTGHAEAAGRAGPPPARPLFRGAGGAARRAGGRGRRRMRSQVPRLDIGASAGPGALGGDEAPAAQVAFEPAWLRRVGGGERRRLSMIRVEGDSMVPTLADGDEILVDRGDRRRAAARRHLRAAAGGRPDGEAAGAQPGRARACRSAATTAPIPAGPIATRPSVDIVGRVRLGGAQDRLS